MRPRFWPWLLVALLFAAAWLTSDVRVRGLLATSFVVSIAAAAIATVLGTFLAVVFLRTNLPGRTAGPWLLGGLLFLPLYVYIAGWETVLGKFGWWTTWGNSIATPLLAGYFATIWIHAVAGLPWVVLFVTAGLATVDPAWEEMTALDMPWSRVLLNITFPAILPFVVLGALWVGIMTAGEMTVTNIYQVRTYAEEIYTDFSREDSLASVIRGAAPGFLILAAVAAGMMLLLREIVPATTIGRMHPSRAWPLGRWQGPVAIVTWLLLGVIVAVPVASMLRESGIVVAEVDGKLKRGWSAMAAAETIGQVPGRNWREAQYSLVISLAAAVVTVVLLQVPVWLAAKSKGLLTPWLLLLPALIPGPLVGIGVILLLNRPEDPTGLLTTLYDDTLVPPILAMLPRTIPIAGLILWSSFRQTPRDLRDMAAIQAKSRWQESWLLIRGLHLRAVAAAFLAADAISAGDLASSILVLPPGVQTISFTVFQFLHAGCSREMAALCLVQFAITAVIGGVVAKLMAMR